MPITRGTRWIAGAAAALSAAAALAPLPVGCGTPRERYEVLSFFFDGVPDPDAPRKAANVEAPKAGPTVAQAKSDSGSRHKPVAEGKCDRCHARPGAGAGFGAVDPSSPVTARGLCIRCHSTEKEVAPQAVVAPPGAWLHGPVANEECLSCHEAHDSPNRRLLRAARAEALCTRCHTDLAGRTGPMAKLDCTDCHDPHRATSAGDRFQRGGPGAACLACHRVGSSERAWLHGPVANGLCARCHDPHGGDVRQVRRPLRTVCLSCHDAASVAASEAHGAGAAVRECDQCHDPHAAKSASERFVRGRRRTG